ncbi:hypothetical protein B0H14DRAFT_3851623 [Mycena olivaceomarginata]|nr:hypothetical protein B0H14DRAFT_3851623 [Mycena olivaceomarginata]
MTHPFLLRKLSFMKFYETSKPSYRCWQMRSHGLNPPSPPSGLNMPSWLLKWISSAISSPRSEVLPEIIAEIFLYFAPSMHHYFHCSDSTYPVQAVLDLGPLWRQPQYGGFLERLVELPILPEFAHSLNPGSSQNDTTPFAEIRNNEDSQGFEIATTLDYKIVHGGTLGPSKGTKEDWHRTDNLRILRMQLSASRFEETDTPAALYVAEIIQSFNMPALENFTLEYYGDTHFNILIPQASPKLKSLRVQAHTRSLFDGLDPFVLERAFKFFQDLAELTVDFFNLISDSVVSRLTPNNVQLPLAPKLEILRLSNRFFVNKSCKWQTLVDILHARFRPVIQRIVQLRTFEFSDNLASDGHVISGLKALRTRYHWDVRVDDECKLLVWDELHL